MFYHQEIGADLASSQSALGTQNEWFLQQASPHNFKSCPCNKLSIGLLMIEHLVLCAQMPALNGSSMNFVSTTPRMSVSNSFNCDKNEIVSQLAHSHNPTKHSWTFIYGEPIWNSNTAVLCVLVENTVNYVVSLDCIHKHIKTPTVGRKVSLLVQIVES